MGLDCPGIYSSLTTDMSGCSRPRCRSVAERLSVQIEEQLFSASLASIAYRHSSSDSYQIARARQCWVRHSSIRKYPLVPEPHLLTLHTKPILTSNCLLNNVCCFHVSKTHFPKIDFNIILLFRHLFRSIVFSFLKYKQYFTRISYFLVSFICIKHRILNFLPYYI